jgi:hypothetical protein
MPLTFVNVTNIPTDPSSPSTGIHATISTVRQMSPHAFPPRRHTYPPMPPHMEVKRAVNAVANYGVSASDLATTELLIRVLRCLSSDRARMTPVHFDRLPKAPFVKRSKEKMKTR